MAVIGAGVVGSAVTLALARCGVAVLCLEAEAEPGLCASGTNSGILHTGFDSEPGELETELIVASVAARERIVDALAIPVLRCGAEMRAGAAAEAVAKRAAANGVEVMRRTDGTVEVPGESVTDPVAYTVALCDEAQRQGAEVRTGFRVIAAEREAGLTIRSEGGDQVRCRTAVNCAGLEADTIAGLLGDDSFAIYPRKGEFLVFEPAGAEPLQRILLPVPTPRTKGVLVFPTVDGKVIAGPTAVDIGDKRDWSVRPEASAEIMPKAVSMYPPLEGAEPVAAYAGLRPAGRGVNYLIGRSAACPQLVNVAAIRSTGLTASLGIADHVVALLGHGPAVRRGLQGGQTPVQTKPWWQRAAEYRAVTA